jgi:two-component system response regulator YesN
MIRVILVEDEPAAMRLLKSVIELRCSGFEVVAAAEDGTEGLEAIRLLKPDIIITDIRMGGMNGIELISRIHEEFPFIYSIIVSGYQDFEYAKGAIRSGASDYLLKPVNANQLQTTLDNIKLKLDDEYCQKRLDILKKIINGGSIDPWQIERYLPFKYYSAAILRKNGLPSRFSAGHGSVYSGIALEINTPLCTKDTNIWTLPGRDENELIFFHTAEIQADEKFDRTIAEYGEKINSGYYTVIFSLKSFLLDDSANVVSEMSRILDKSIVMGASQRIIAKESQNMPEKQMILDETLINKISYMLSNMMYDELYKEFKKIFAVWEKEKRTLHVVENNLRQLLHYVEKYSAGTSGHTNSYNTGFLLEEALYYSASFDELLSNVWEVVEKITERSEKKKSKMDSQEFLKNAQQYIEKNLSEQISLQSVCSAFGISQPYLSRLFRKYENMSFNEYLTKKRIDKAKQLISENPSIPLKDVATFAGYSDPFYFSRVFRSITGMPPSEYAETNQ